MKNVHAFVILALTGCSASPEHVATTTQAVTHSDGLGHSWTDTTPLGTYTDAEALAACQAFSPGQCAYVATCAGATASLYTTFGATPPNDVWGWIFSGPSAGGVVHVTSKCLTAASNGTCSVAQRASSLCVAPAIVAPSEVPPPLTIVGQWQ